MVQRAVNVAMMVVAIVAFGALPSAAFAQDPDTVGLTPLQQLQTLGLIVEVVESAPLGMHVERNADGSVTLPEPYSSQPPTAGWHIGNEVGEWGVSKQPLEPAVFVHNLEHGGVMLQYSCECPDTVAMLERFADPATGYPSAVIAAPYPDMDAEVALTAWNRLWTMPAADVTPERLRAFIDLFINEGPERIPSQISAIREWRADAGRPKPWEE